MSCIINCLACVAVTNERKKFGNCKIKKKKKFETLHKCRVDGLNYETIFCCSFRDRNASLKKNRNLFFRANIEIIR